MSKYNMNESHQTNWFKVLTKVFETVILFVAIASGIAVWFNYHVDMFARILFYCFFGGLIVCAVIDFMLFVNYEKKNLVKKIEKERSR